MSSNILITGATGFIGSHLINRPELSKYKKHAFVRYVAGRYVLGEDINKTYGNLTDYFTVKQLIKDLKPEIVVHLAAISAVSYSYEHPQEVIDSNYVASVNLAEACLRENPNLKKFIYASTSETYGNNGNDIQLEEYSQVPNSPYSASKKATEDYLRYMFKAYNFPMVIARPFNTYGRKNDNHFMIERAITQMIRNPSDIYLGDPEPTRDWMYVDDHVNGYIKLIESNSIGVIGNEFNFCTGKSYSIKETVELIKTLAGYTGNVHWGTIPKRPLDINHLQGSNSKAHGLLGWQPEYSLEAGLSKTIDYWRNKK